MINKCNMKLNQCNNKEQKCQQVIPKYVKMDKCKSSCNTNYEEYNCGCNNKVTYNCNMNTKKANNYSMKN